LSVLPGLDRTKFSRLFVENYCVDVLLPQNIKDILPPLRDEAIWEKIPVSDNHAENRLLLGVHKHGF
jgi:hypothetical protein